MVVAKKREDSSQGGLSENQEKGINRCRLHVQKQHIAGTINTTSQKVTIFAQCLIHVQSQISFRIYHNCESHNSIERLGNSGIVEQRGGAIQ